MKRRLFTIASALSMVLFVATVGFWVIPYLAPGALPQVGTGKDEKIWIQPGRITLMRIRPGTAFEYSVFLRMNPTYRGPQGMTVATPLWSVPMWPLVVASFSLVVAWPILRFWYRYRYMSRASQGSCPACGYDLRASTGRCPECGTEITSNAGTPA